MCSSTRAEIAAIVLAFTDQEAIHVGVDNQGAISNTVRLINTAVQYERKATTSPNWKPPPPLPPRKGVGITT